MSGILEVASSFVREKKVGLDSVDVQGVNFYRIKTDVSRAF